METLRASFIKAFDQGPRVEADFELPLAGGGATVLFGASGSGKTTVLRALAGLDRPDSGSIATDDERWFGEGAWVPPHRRRVGLVFQEGALFPHLSVAANIAFGLRHMAPTIRAARVAELVAVAGLEGLEGRRPSELSGGQRQRAALARALAPSPRLLLLDEPFASLDRPAQIQLRRALKDTLRRLGIPALLVTHDQEEALTLGGRMLVIQGGRIIQRGAPAEVFSAPATAELAALVGRGTVLPVKVLGRSEGMLTLEHGGARLSAPGPSIEGDAAFAWIRAEDVVLERHRGDGSARNVFPVRVRSVEAAPPLLRVHLEGPFALEALVTAGAAADLDLREGAEVHALIKASAIRVIGA